MVSNIINLPENVLELFVRIKRRILQEKETWMFNQSFLKLRIMNIIQTELQTSVDVSQEIFVFFYWEGSCNEVKIYQMEFQTFQQKYQKKNPKHPS